MKFFFKFLFFIVAVCSMQMAYAIDVKVLLASQDLGSYELSSKKGFIFKDPVSGKQLKTVYEGHHLDLECRPEGVFVDGKKLFSQSLVCEPASAAISYNGNVYSGSFVIQKVADNYLLINRVPLEEYVLSVLKTESWPGWPLEVNKAFATMTRTYVLHQIMLSYQKKLPYHIRSTNHHQTYTGIHSCSVSKQAVSETKGLFVSYKNMPILAMFDACCGGIIPAHIEGVVDFKKAPYLARDYACLYCRNAQPFRWTTTFSVSDFIDFLQLNASFVIRDIKNIEVLETDKAGLVKKVLVESFPQEIELTGDQMYRLSNKIKSYAYTVTKKGKKIIIKGKGLGHHLGLCQWGAREMVRFDFDFKGILSFYYPGTELMRFVDEDHKGKNIKGGLCQDIKGILSAVQLRSRA